MGKRKRTLPHPTTRMQRNTLSPRTEHNHGTLEDVQKGLAASQMDYYDAKKVKGSEFDRMTSFSSRNEEGSMRKESMTDVMSKRKKMKFSDQYRIKNRRNGSRRIGSVIEGNYDLSENNNSNSKDIMEPRKKK